MKMKMTSEEALRRGAASKDRSARQAHSLKVAGSNPAAATASVPHPPESAPALISGPARSSLVLWKDVKAELPDDEITVLVALEEGDVWVGFRDAGVWRYTCATLIEQAVLFWADLPEPPPEVKR